MKWVYCLNEGIDGLLRAKMAAFLSALTMAVALIIVGTFVLVTINLVSIIESLRSRIELEVFVDNSLDDGKIQKLRQQLEAIAGVASVRYVSREEAAEIFRKEFGNDFLALLQSNPLPPSFRIHLQKPFQNSTAAQVIATRLEAQAGIDDVVYRRDFIQLLDRYISFVVVMDLLVGIVVCLGAIFVLINQVRLVAFAKRRILETMQLVGADPFLVRGPFLVQGLVQGIIGSCLATVFFYFCERLFFADFQEVLVVPSFFYFLLIATGIVLGLLAAYLGARRFAG